MRYVANMRTQHSCVKFFSCPPLLLVLYDSNGVWRMIVWWLLRVHFSLTCNSRSLAIIPLTNMKSVSGCISPIRKMLTHPEFANTTFRSWYIFSNILPLVFVLCCSIFLPIRLTHRLLFWGGRGLHQRMVSPATMWNPQMGGSIMRNSYRYVRMPLILHVGIRSIFFSETVTNIDMIFDLHIQTVKSHAFDKWVA